MGAQRESNPRGETLSRLTPQPPAPTATPKTAKTEKTKETASGVGAGIEPTRGDPIGLAGRRLNRLPPPHPENRENQENQENQENREKPRKQTSRAEAGIEPTRGDPID